jgi:tetratricopeptide (TPR) repeat protein
MAEENLTDFDSLWDYDHPAETERRFRELLGPGKGAGVAQAELLTQIARAQGLQRKFAEAHQTLDQAEAWLDDSLPRARVRYLLERGRVLNSSGRPQEAEPYFTQALALASAAGEDFYAVDAAHMLAIVAPPPEQLAWNLKALELAESSTQARARNWLGSLYNNLGWTYHDQGDYPTALDYFQRALAFRQAQGRSKEILIARWCVARALRSLSRVAEALAVQRELLAEYEQAGETSGYVYEELGECLLVLDEAGAARPYFALAYTELSQDPWLAENEPDRIARLAQLGGLRQGED